MLKARGAQVLVCSCVCLHCQKAAGELKYHQRSNMWELTVGRGGKLPGTKNPEQFYPQTAQRVLTALFCLLFSAWASHLFPH